MLYRSGGTPFFTLRREIDRLFEDTFGRSQGGNFTWSPAVDVRESDQELTLEFELPGINPEDVEVTAENGVLTVRGEKREERKEGEEGRFHLVERTYGSFSRSFQLPQGLEDEQIQADYENGVLRVRIPKAALQQPRRIQIGQSRREQGRVGSGAKDEGARRGGQQRGTGQQDVTPEQRELSYAAEGKGGAESGSERGRGGSTQGRQGGAQGRQRPGESEGLNARGKGSR